MAEIVMAIVATGQFLAFAQQSWIVANYAETVEVSWGTQMALILKLSE